MGRHMTLEEFLKAFTDEETESVSDAISVRVSDAEVYRLGCFFIQLMGGVAQCLERGPSDPLLTDLSEAPTNNDDDLIH